MAAIERGTPIAHPARRHRRHRRVQDSRDRAQLTERAAKYKSVMTAGARQFVTPSHSKPSRAPPCATISGIPPRKRRMGHIELARWADVVVVAPATADFLATSPRASPAISLPRFARDHGAIGRGPGHESRDVGHPATQANRAVLDSRGVAFPRAGGGDQACGETGPGRMVEADGDRERAARAPRPAALQSLAGARVVITAGRPGRPSIRSVTSRTVAPGRWGCRRDCRRDAGADVVLVSGPVALPTPPECGA